MFQEVQLCVLNFASKVRALAHPTCNGNARLEAWLFACLARLVVCAKFDIFDHGNEERKRFHCFLRLVPPNILETSVYNIHDVQWLGVLLWCKCFSCSLNSRCLRWERGLFQVPCHFRDSALRLF